jgi:hypothetical protein
MRLDRHAERGGIAAAPALPRGARHGAIRSELDSDDDRVTGALLAGRPLGNVGLMHTRASYGRKPRGEGLLLGPGQLEPLTERGPMAPGCTSTHASYIIAYAIATSTVNLRWR